MNNTAALGATIGLLEYDFEKVAEVVMAGFSGKARKVGEMNVHCARLAHDFVRENYGGKLAFSVPAAPKDTGKQMMIKGTQAVAIAKLQAGCGVQTYYPISPATDESVYLENQQSDYGLLVVQTEDEVSAVDAAVMAAHGGARASTSTSGPGFALMPEGLGFAAITEAPGPVVVSYMRGGPSTGLPTRHEQGDLQFALKAGQGDIPRIVMAPADMTECFYDTYDAFNYADRYQVPVIILVDRHLAALYVSTKPFDTAHLKIDRGELFDPEKDGDGQYMRYRFTESGISPRSIPGQPGGIFWTTSDEHDQVGHITEGIGNRLAMVLKRMGKIELAAREIPQEKKLTLYGKKKAPTTVLSWGSTKGAILDGLARLDPEQQNFNFVQLRILQPFPTREVEEILNGSGKVAVLECNYSGQLAALLREKTGIQAHHRILKYEGRPFSEDEVVAALEAATAGAGEEISVAEGRVVDAEYGRREVERLVELRKTSRRMLAPMVPLPPGYNR
jgi:2-oxoglutarate ferredoxin oxidoreductase subunit alpha